ncbi:MAG: amidohydrolase family protein, partial [Candidatus Bathyarchaeota archaeon]
MQFDILIKNSFIINGTGNPWFQSSLGVSNGKIEAIGALNAANATTVIDASGLILAPGFIDMHSHTDFRYLVNSKAESKIRQGVTTEVIGNCGNSAAPLKDSLRERILKTMPYLTKSGVNFDWSTMAEYMHKIEEQGISLNVAPLVGHGTVRAYVMGYEQRAPTR